MGAACSLKLLLILLFTVAAVGGDQNLLRVEIGLKPGDQ